MKRFAPIFALALVLLVGCMSPADLRRKRIETYPVEYAALAEGERARAAAGQYAVGDSATSVWFALGEPDRKTQRMDASGTVEIWTYDKSVPEPYQVLVHEPAFRPVIVPSDGPGRPGPHVILAPAGMRTRTETRTRWVTAPGCVIEFRDGRLVAAQTF